MQIIKAVIAVICITLFCTQIATIVSAKPIGPEDFLHTEGNRILNESGGVVTLRGVNIGSWLLIEPWIIGAEGNGIEAEDDIWDKMRNNPNLNESQRHDLLKVFRDNWFTEYDTRCISETGMNCVRLPIRYNEVNSSEYYEDLAYVDRCIQWCKNNGLYVILDLHSAPGGQNNEIKNTGNRSYKSLLWVNAEFQNKTVNWWGEIAKKYKDEPTIAGYDLINEAVLYNGSGDINESIKEMEILYNRIYKATRKGDNHIIILEVGMDSYNLSRLSSPNKYDWTNVVYSFHYYPFNKTFKNAYKDTRIDFPKFQAIAMRYGVPMLVGEFNSIEMKSGGVDLFKQYCNIFDYYGWSWTFWTFKKIENNNSSNWGLYGYMNNSTRINFSSNEFETIKSAFENMSTEHTNKTDLLKNLTQWNRHLKGNQNEILLTMWNATLSGGVQMEWNSIPNAGFWDMDGIISWRFEVPATDDYQVNLWMAKGENINGTRENVEIVPLSIDGNRSEHPVNNTGGWDQYENSSLEYNLETGSHNLSISRFDRDDKNSSFLNLRSVWLERIS